MSRGLRALFHQERFYLDTLANAKQFMDEYQVELHSGQLTGWKQRIDGLDDKFHANRLAIELSMDDEEDQSKSDKKTETKPSDEAAQVTEEAAKAAAEESNRLIRQKFELDYVLVYSFLVNEIQKQTSSPQANLNSTSHGQSRVKLPDVKLPTFDGTISEWITFRDSFKSLIDSNVDLSPFDKFSYLLASLTPEARKNIDSIDVTAANYPVAWQVLESRFDNKKLIFKTYMDSLFAIEPMRKESYHSLAQLVDAFERNLNMVKKLEIPTDGWSVLLAHMVCSRLDPSTLKQWESHYRSTDVPEYKDIMAFLRSHLSVLQSLPTKLYSSESYKQEQHRPLTSKTIHAVTSPATSLCPFCSNPTHSAFICEVFQRLSVPDRYDMVKRNNLCINCLSSEHIVCNCTSGTCRINNCHQKHHTMLHFSPEDHPPNPITQTAPRSSSPSSESPAKPSYSQSPLSSPSPSGSQPPSATSLVSTNVVGAPRVPATVLLQTAIVKVFEPNGHYQWARALLDPASQLNLITENIVQRLKLHRYKCHQSIGGVGNSVVTSLHAVQVRLGSRCTDFKTVQSFRILKKITQDLPATPLDSSSWTVPPDITLADPKFFQPSSIDLLLGMEIYYDLLLDGFTKLGPAKPILQNTVFGWVASGKIGSSQANGTLKFAHVCCDESHNPPCSRESDRFVVTLPKQSTILTQMEATRRIFVIYLRTVSIDGRISVKLLWAKSKIALTGKAQNTALLSLPLLELSTAHLFHKFIANRVAEFQRLTAGEICSQAQVIRPNDLFVLDSSFPLLVCHIACHCQFQVSHDAQHRSFGSIPPLKWRYGQVGWIYRGDHNDIRVFVVRTAEGEYTWSISKIYANQSPPSTLARPT